MNSADMSGLERKRWNWEKSRNYQIQLQKRSVFVITALQESDTEVQKIKETMLHIRAKDDKLFLILPYCCKNSGQ